MTGLPKQLLRRVRSLTTRQQAAILGALIAAVGLSGFLAYRSITRSAVISTASEAGGFAEVIDSAPSIAETLPSPSPAATVPTVAAPPAPSPSPIFGLVKSIDKTGAYLVNRDGSVLRRIIDNVHGTGNLSCAPDGVHFSFQSINSGYVADLNGSVKKISDVGIGRASWSADSKYVAHARSTNGSEWDIAIINVASGQRRDIHTPWDDGHVVWSSRGRLATSKNSTEGIIIMKDDGSEMNMVYDPPNTIEEMKWSPDGGTLVVGRSPSVLIEEDGSNLRSLGPDEGDFNVWSPDWSPTSSEIVFQGGNRTTGERFLQISPRQGGTSRAIARDLYHPAWSPDGTTIAALETDHDPAFQRLVTISPTGQGKRTVVSAPPKATISEKPCWLGPDQILFDVGVSS